MQPMPFGWPFHTTSITRANRDHQQSTILGSVMGSDSRERVLNTIDEVILQERTEEAEEGSYTFDEI